MPSLSSLSGDTRMLTLFKISDLESSVSDAVSLSVNLFRPLRRCDADGFVRPGDALRAGERFLDGFLDERLNGGLLEARVVRVFSTAVAAPLLRRSIVLTCTQYLLN